MAIDVDQMKLELGAAYAKIAEGREENFALWQGAIRKWGQAVAEHHRGEGFGAPRLFWLRWQRELMPPITPPDALRHVDYLVACATDAGPDFVQHWKERQEQEGNVFLEVTGYTGSGKSSCAIHLAHASSPIEPAHLANHLAIDFAELPDKMPRLKAGQTLVVDEYLRTSGEGSKTLRDMVANMEDTIRASQVNVVWCSPESPGHDTSQAILEALLVDWERRRTRFLLWVDQQPLGTVTIPWCTPAHYGVYQPWKTNNVDRMLRGNHRDNGALARVADRLFHDEGFTEYLMALNKPKKADIEQGVSVFYRMPLTSSQQDSVARFIHTVSYKFEAMEKLLRVRLGVTPNAAWREFAKKCFDE